MEDKYITLESEILEVKKILKSTKAVMFCNLKVGDRIQLSVKVRAVGRNRRTYATYITIKNIRTRESTGKSFNQIEEVLKCFELEPIEY